MIKLPYNYTPRDYQKPVWKAFFDDKIRHLLLLWHRRAGKDITGINITLAAALQRVGDIYYLFPQLKQARRVVWEGRGADGIRFLDHIPPELIRRINHADMMIELINGSLFRLCGSDFYDVLRGSNPMGVVYSEYAKQHPIARETLLPILAENNGFEMFFYTPDGQNHGYELYQLALANPDKWYCKKLTIDDTLRPDGTPVVSRERAAEMIAGGMSPEMAAQEFDCSFTAAVKGAYFGHQLQAAEADNRILDFPIDQSNYVDSYWDIGVNDSTAIWFVQTKATQYYSVDYYENTGEGLEHYINVIDEFKRDNGVVHRRAFFPHDGKKREFTTGRSIDSMARRLGLDVAIIPKTNNKINTIEATRRFFNKVTFHKTNCYQGIRALREYHAKYDEKFKVLGAPQHDWSSHGADAFMGIAQMEDKVNSGGYRTYRNRVGLQ